MFFISFYKKSVCVCFFFNGWEDGEVWLVQGWECGVGTSDSNTGRLRTVTEANPRGICLNP